MKSPRFILALQNQSVLAAWMKITAACRARRVAMLSSLSFILLGAIVFTAPSRLAAQAAAATRPNIVVIMTDDQTLGQMQVLTKTRQLIEAQGTNFRNFYVSCPMCCPSRATFLTGQYPHNHGVLLNCPGGYTTLDNNNTLPVWLQQAGYFTSHIGKYLNGYGQYTPPTLVPPGWTDWQGLVDPSTYGFYNYTINDNGTLVAYGDAPTDYQTDVLASRAVETIDEAVLQQPFFLSIAPVPPHQELVSTGQALAPPQPAPRYQGAFAQAPLPQPPSFNESDVSDKPVSVRELPLLDASDIQELMSRHRARLAALLAVDDLVARVVNELAATGVLNNTVIIFTTDNGFFNGEHRLKKGKRLAYEEDVHMPLLIRGAGFPQGTTANQFVSNTDLAPTIVDLANASPGRIMDGRSLLPLVQNPSLATAHNLLIAARGRRNAISGTYQALRNQSFLYVEHMTGERELYDMRPGTANYDPYQLQSRHADPAYAGVMAQLAAKLNQLRTCSGIGCEVQ
ncbi:MAG: sulfatase [Pseudomonadota bacterium]|nr:sulfatase [Pseudomonadota bacterium]